MFLLLFRRWGIELPCRMIILMEVVVTFIVLVVYAFMQRPTPGTNAIVTLSKMS